MNANLTLSDMLSITDERRNGPRIPSVQYELSPEAKSEKVLKEVDENDLSHVPAEYQTELRDLPKKHSFVFDYSLGEVNVVERNI